ncbi:MAG: DUF4388 domain-containing protein [Acidobacteria bacterium]|nr:DUF4388 domain-containing protein [Acidobacteriota bacterium]
MGDLARTLLSEELRRLLRARRSGVLVLSQGDVTKGLFLRAGQIVFASSTHDGDKLGESLIRLGRISRAEFAAAHAAIRAKKRRLGEELVGAGLITEEELGRVVAHQVQKIVLSVFTWTDGDAVFQENPEPIPADLALDLSTHRLLLEGARIFPDVDRLEKAVGRASRRLRVSTHPPFDYSRVNLSPVERGVLNDAADEMRVADMLARPAPRALLVRAVYALLVGGVLDEPGEKAEERLVEGDTGTFRIAVAAEEPPVETVRERILRRYEALPRATHYEVLGVGPDADGEALAAGYRGLSDEEEREWRGLQGDVRLASVLSTLRLRQREAFRILSDPELRRRYDRTLGGLEPAKAQDVTAEAHGKAVRLARQALGMLEKGERDAAIPVLLRAAESDPRDPGVRRLLAVTLAQHRTLFRTAERHFLAALEMEPGDVELRYRLALYYRRAGLPKRAVAQLRAVLTAHPQHEGARVELAALGELERG